MGNAKITIICGHYGCGKTNLALNLALEAAGQGRRVKLADLDVVNPYFRSSDYGPALREKGVELFCPTYAGTTLDLPAVGPQLLQLPEAECDDVILDAGGDDAGASVLGCMAPLLFKKPYTMLYVVNARRVLTQTAAEAAAIGREIEKACRLSITGVVNNTHLQNETTAQMVLDSMPFAKETARLLGVPLVFTTAPDWIAPAVLGDIPSVKPVKRLVLPPWQTV
ncbi:MAG: ParA family protein [Acutalibacteraceae bacterium]